MARLALALALVPAAALCGRAPAEKQIQTAGATPAAKAGDMFPPRPTAPPPRGKEEIDETLRRIFGTALQADPGRVPPGFFVGDFNADGSADLAVVTRPAADSISVLNDALAPWLIRDAQQANPAGASDATLKVAQDDVLLAVVHGYGEAGWRNPEARHGYLLRHAVGDQMRSRRADEVISVTEPGARAVGDVIAGMIDGRTGFLYWTGTRYLWRRL